MRLIYKGIFKGVEQLPIGELPEKAVKFKEADSMESLTLYTYLYAILTMPVISLFVAISFLFHGEINISFSMPGFSLGLVAPLITLIPHELLHAVAFGKGADVEMFISPKHLSMFVVSTTPISKKRFIVNSLLPNLIFGWIPLVVWLLLPYTATLSAFLFWFSAASILMGSGDYYNIVNALRQMPKNSMHQHSGLNSYWFIPSKSND